MLRNVHTSCCDLQVESCRPAPHSDARIVHIGLDVQLLGKVDPVLNYNAMKMH